MSHKHKYVVTSIACPCCGETVAMATSPFATVTTVELAACPTKAAEGLTSTTVLKSALAL
jgi:hypothetical protein